jgi:hypothetical protein
LWVGRHRSVIRYTEFGESTARHRIGWIGAGSQATIVRLCDRPPGGVLSLASLRGSRNTGMVGDQPTRYVGPNETPRRAASPFSLRTRCPREDASHTTASARSSLVETNSTWR